MALLFIDRISSLIRISLWLLICCLIPYGGLTQDKQVVISLDDIPNIHAADGLIHSYKLLEKLDSMALPMCIFVNEGYIHKGDSTLANMDLLLDWMDGDYMTVGNHSYLHANYGEVGFESFSREVLKGESISRPYLERHDKKLEYFRFPYNNLGNNQSEQVRIAEFLAVHGYQIAPFTVESEDWIYTTLYEDALKAGDQRLAAQLGQRYVSESIKLFHFFDSLSIQLYGRSIPQIYLCHDNRLNADYLPLLVQNLQALDYQFISMETAMADPVYALPLHFYGKWGISWIYRWIADPEERKSLMRAAPYHMDIYEAYQKR